MKWLFKRNKSSVESSLIEMNSDEIKIAVAKRYGEVATNPCAEFNFPVGRKFAESVGYSAQVLDKLPPSIWESFTGAGNPQPYVDIVPGETVLDLGCGAGLDLYLYAQAAGSDGKVYGLDLSEEMIAKARQNMKLLNVQNAEFICGPADCIPLPGESIDIVTANGIYNLSPDKNAVMREVVRVLRPNGRTIFAEIVLKAPLPEGDFLGSLELAGFSDSKVLWKGRNARTGHKLAVCAVIRAEK